MRLVRHAVSAARGGWRRSLATMLAVFTAVTAFVVLTGTAETQRLEATQTVEDNFRGSYDILVRPAGAASALERSDGLVRSAATSTPSGGIDFDQLAAIRDVPGVEVAAPLASVGFVVLNLYDEKEVGPGLADTGEQRLAWYTITASSRNGHFSRQVEEGYYYQTSQIMEDEHGLWDLSGDVPTSLCEVPRTMGPDDGWVPICKPLPGSTVTVGDGTIVLDEVPSTIGLFMGYPLLIAAIDPQAEQQLSGLDTAVFDGRPLRPDDGIQMTESDPHTPAVRALLATQQEVDLTMDVTVRQAPAELIDDFLARDESARRQLLLDADLPVSLRVSSTAEELFSEKVAGKGLGRLHSSESSLAPHESLVRTGEVTITIRKGVVEPAPLDPDPVAWRTSRSGFDVFPPTVADTAYRQAERLQVASSTYSNIFTFDIVGMFDPDALSGSNSLGELPMDTFRAADVAVADAATETVLGGQRLLSDLNPAGYLQSAPALLISMEGLKFFTEGRYIQLAEAPLISSVRVRVAGITGMDDVSRERIRLVAERIAAATGLDMDIVIGSSTTRMAVELPASELGVPQLNLTEAWTKKGVAVSIVAAVDAKSVALFVLILASCAVTVAVVAQASVAARRRELGILAACGWTAGRRVGVLLLEAALLGGLAGTLGALVAWPLTGLLAVNFDPVRAASAIPTAMLLTVLASIGAALGAGRLSPVAAMAPRVRQSRRRLLAVRGPATLGLTAVLQRPGRLLAGAVAVGLGVASLLVLLVFAAVFEGAVVGTVLGDAVAIQVRAPDLVAAGLLVVMGLIAVGVILFLGVVEDARNLATLLATGWRPGQLLRSVVTQAALIAVLGVVFGVAASAGGLYLLLGEVPAELWQWGVGIGAGMVLAGIAVGLGAGGALGRLPLAGLLSAE